MYVTEFLHTDKCAHWQQLTLAECLDDRIHIELSDTFIGKNTIQRNYLPVSLLVNFFFCSWSSFSHVCLFPHWNHVKLRFLYSTFLLTRHKEVVIAQIHEIFQCILIFWLRKHPLYLLASTNSLPQYSLIYFLTSSAFF